MKLNFLFWAVLLCSWHTQSAYGQGCSDAGFCTINSFKPATADSAAFFNNQFKLGAFLGQADYNITAYGTFLEYHANLNKQFGLDLKLTSLAQTGNDLAVAGLADMFVNLNYKTSEKLTLTLGTKIPFSRANRTYNGLPLPMDYQASLGTFDLIFGVGYKIRRLQLVAAIQQPLTQNENEFFGKNYPIQSILRTFQSTNRFERSGDILLRVSYPLKIAPKLTLTPGILPIYHLANDKFTDESNVRKEILGSKGLTLNGNAYLDYAINRKNMIQLNLGVPFVVRDARPDGLTRSLVLNFEYAVKF